MSKIVMNATTVDLISALTIDNITLLSKMNPDALCLKDKDGDTKFKVMTAITDCIGQYGIAFKDKDRNGHAVITFSYKTDLPQNELFDAIFDKVGRAKVQLDEIEKQALIAVEAENERKAAFVAELTGDTAEAAENTETEG